MTVSYYDKYKVAVPAGKSGDWAVSQFTIAEHDFGAMVEALHGRPIDPGTYTKLTHGGHVIMSDTQMELREHLHFIRMARGNCLINGLGLGMVLKAILQKPEVTHVDVVEISQDVINLVYPTYQTDPRVALSQGDAYTVEWPKDKRWDCVWHDIWSDICADNLEGVAKLKRKYGRRTDYQAAWNEDILRSHRRRDRANRW